MKRLSWLRRFWGKLLIITIVESGLPKDEIRISGKKLYISREAIKEIIKESDERTVDVQKEMRL